MHKNSFLSASIRSEKAEVFFVETLFYHIVKRDVCSIPYFCFCCCQDIAGVRPTFTDRNLTIQPNHESIVSRMWMPGVDEGYIPQGVTVAEVKVIVASYNSEGFTPKCRIYRMEPETMTITGHFDLGHYCGHAGGLAYAGLGRPFISDTWRLYEIDLTKAFSQTQSEEMLVRSYSLKFPLRG